VTARRLFALLGWACFALALALLVGGVWSALLLANLATGAALPWSVAVMSALLWVLWRYLGGRGWPASTEAARRRRRRARPVPHELMAWALCAGVLGDVALAGAWIVLVQLGGMTGRTLPDFSHYPLYAVALFLTMSSLVNGVTEEVAFRGYLQGELEPELGGVAAVALTALVMAPAHASSQGFAWSLVAFYFAVDAMFGATALLTDSVLPGIATHALGIGIFFASVWPRDGERVAVGSGGAGPWFWMHVAQTVGFGGLAIWSFHRLARHARRRSLRPANDSTVG